MGFRERHRIPDLGVGIGCRSKHYPVIFDDRPAMDWFEIISENFMAPGGRPRRNLERLLEHYRLVPHGVSLSIGSTDPIDEDHLAKLKALVDRVKPPWCSDHLCWTGAAGRDVHDLLPLPLTRESLDHVVERVRRVQGTLEVPFALENVSSYMTYRQSSLAEWDFLAEAAERADCGILLDVNNIYVSAKNHGFDPDAYVDAIPKDRVVQIHLAGHTDKGSYLLDTHSDHVAPPVWDLYRRALRRLGAVSTLVEWDEDIPAFEVVAEEAARARVVRAEVLGEAKREVAAWPPQ